MSATISESESENNLLLPTKSADSTKSAAKKAYFSDVPYFIWIELSLLINVFLSGFDGTIAASTFSTIGNEFRAISLASWITSSYLITSTAFQPLYGSISDILGRKTCIVFALSVFSLGSYGCFLATNMPMLIVMRGVTGIGGGGLVSLSTITNSDLIFPEKRALFQAVQNLLYGLGAVFGASFGGYLTSLFGWRWCFAVQIIPAVLSILVSVVFIGKSEDLTESENLSLFHKIDFPGSATLVCSLTAQLLILSLGGNLLRWTDWKMVALGLLMLVATYGFLRIEATTLALPIIPIRDYFNKFSVLSVTLSYCIGLASYSYLFTLPLLFQINLGDSTTKSGLRLAIPSLATPIGGITTGLLMARSSKHLPVIPLWGCFLMTIGNFGALLISNSLPDWLIDTMLVPANIGQGLAYPSSLFLFIYYFESSQQASSTSTVYLMRNIGGVWGVTYISSVTQFVLRKQLVVHLAKLGYLKRAEIKHIILDILHSTDSIAALDPQVRAIVVHDYTFALRVSQALSGTCCLVGFVCFYLSRSSFVRESKQWR